jgi:hypothetical protein
MPNLRAHLCNCLIGGHKAKQEPNGDSILDTIEWNLDGYEVSLRQKKEIAIGSVSKYKNEWHHTTDVVIHDVSPEHHDTAKELVFDLSILLSFICESRIWPFKLEYPDGSGLCVKNPSVGTTQYFRPVINIRDGEAVYNFVHNVWNGYKTVKLKRKLKELFHYLILTELPDIPVELMLIIVFTMLENLKDTWARSRKIPFASGFFRKVSHYPRASIKRAPIYGFEDMLHSMLKEMNMRRGLKRIVRLRNDLIHSGLSRRSSQSQYNTYEVCRDIIREYLLRLIGYSGEYFPYSEPNTVKTI